MKLFRKIVFWLHLTAGVVAGIVIFIMSVTGAVLAFQPQIERFVEREVRTVQMPEADARRLDAKTLLEKAQAARPNIKPSGLTIQSDPNAAVALALGRDGTLYVNPYNGDVLGENSKSTRSFFQFMTDWHRWLAASGENRPIGKAITGFCNAAFLLLAITGVYLWFPRKFSRQHFKPILWFRGGLKGKARDFNWHNVIGFWSSLVLIVLTASALVISYQWASNLLYTLTGNEPPPSQQPQQQAPQRPQNGEPFIVPANIEVLWTRAEQQSEGWKSISLRLPLPENAPAVFTIDEGKSWNPFGRSTLTLNPQNAEVVKWEPYGELNAGRQLRSWARFTHTGESFGIIGQITAFLACIGGGFLVWTGISLALRRLCNLFAKRSKTSSFAKDIR